MSAYLQLLEEKKEMGLISNKYFKSQTKWYNLKDLDKSIKATFDSQAEKKLAILKQDTSTFLTVELISVVNDTKTSTNQIKGWVTFFGVLYIVGIVVTVLIFAMSKQ